MNSPGSLNWKILVVGAGALLLGLAGLASPNANPHPWTIEYFRGFERATIPQSGKVTVARSPVEGWSQGKTRNMKYEGKPEEVAELFNLAAGPQFLGSEENYLPREGTFAYHGHSVVTLLTLKDATGKTIHQVRYSSKSERPVPPEVTQLGSKISEFLSKRFGPSPPLLLD